MAMNKAEQAALADAHRMLRLHASMHMKGEKIARDLPIPAPFAPMIYGWDFNLHSGRVFKACSNVQAHGYSWDKTDTRDGRALFSTQQLALRALRAELELQFADRLAALDVAIACASTEVHK